MKKRLIGSLIAGIMIFSLVGCGGNEKSNEEGNNAPVVAEENSEDKSDDKDASKENLDSGQRKVTKEEIVEIANNNFTKLKELLNGDNLKIYESNKYSSGVVGVDYVGNDYNTLPTKKDSIRDINIDFSESNNAGSFVLCVNYNINIDEIKESKKIDLRKLPFEKYLNVFMQDYSFNYDELNKKINEIYKNSDKNFEYEGVLYEERDGNVIQIIAYDKFISLKVTSPQYIYK